MRTGLGLVKSGRLGLGVLHGEICLVLGATSAQGRRPGGDRLKVPERAVLALRVNYVGQVPVEAGDDIEPVVVSAEAVKARNSRNVRIQDLPSSAEIWEWWKNALIDNHLKCSSYVDMSPFVGSIQEMVQAF